MPANVQAGWSTRRSGVSSQPFDSFNVGRHVGDAASIVEQNRQLLRNRLQGYPEISWLNQTHSILVTEASQADSNKGQDASHTQRPKLACCVMTADCLPVFFWDAKGEQVAMAHAGWRGLADGILLKTLSTFSNPEKVYCGLGPAIGFSSFEVGEDVKSAFHAWLNIDSYFQPKPIAGKYCCDLPGLASEQLLAQGVQKVYRSNFCTLEQTKMFYSYRREGKTGRMANLIWKLS